jgi:hypothetical protein
MTTPCQALRHAVHTRRVGDLVTAYCETCACLCRRLPLDLPAQPRSAPPRLDQAADWQENELRAAWGDR